MKRLLWWRFNLKWCKSCKVVLYLYVPLINTACTCSHSLIRILFNHQQLDLPCEYISYVDSWPTIWLIIDPVDLPDVSCFNHFVIFVHQQFASCSSNITCYFVMHIMFKKQTPEHTPSERLEALTNLPRLSRSSVPFEKLDQHLSGILADDGFLVDSEIGRHLIMKPFDKKWRVITSCWMAISRHHESQLPITRYSSLKVLGIRIAVVFSKVKNNPNQSKEYQVIWAV